MMSDPPPGSRQFVPSVSTKPPNRTGLIVIVAIAIVVLLLFCCCPVLIGTISRTPTPTVNVGAIQTSAAGTAYAAAEQTAQAAPTNTLASTITPAPSNTFAIESTSTPTITPRPTATLAPTIKAFASSTTSACLAAYPDFCIPPGPHINCEDLGRHNFTVLAPDPQNYDRDNDGLGCEG